MKGIAGFYDKFRPLTGQTKPLDTVKPEFMDALTKLSAILLRNKFLTPG
jgi:hypothetical protein